MGKRNSNQFDSYFFPTPLEILIVCRTLFSCVKSTFYEYSIFMLVYAAVALHFEVTEVN